MTQQDDITQRVLTDDEIRDIITGTHQAFGEFKPGYMLVLGRAIESALLSKLRASVTDERGKPKMPAPARAGDFYPDFMVQPVGTAEIYAEVIESWARQDERDRASAPVAGAAQEYCSPADVAQRIEQYLAQDGRMNSGTQLLYEAMKALRASQGDRNDG